MNESEAGHIGRYRNKGAKASGKAIRKRKHMFDPVTEERRQPYGAVVKRIHFFILM
jgi:hypothetical protein